MPSRRAYLGTLAAVGIAGCTDTQPSDDPTDNRETDSNPTGSSPTDSSPTPLQSPESPGLEFVDASVAYSVRHILYTDHNGVYTADGKQFVVVTVDDSGGPAHSLSEFSLVADGESHSPTTFQGGEPHSFDSSKRAYRSGSDAYRTGRKGWFCFVVPDQLEAIPTLRLDGEDGKWEWTPDDLERATMPPPGWEWTASAPETVPPNSTFEIEFSATNVGDGPGQFRAAVNFSNLYYQTRTVGISLAPGESGTATVEAESGEPGELFTYGVRTAAGNTDLEVTIESESETATATETE